MEKKICLNCGKYKALNVPPYGLLPCKRCQARQRAHSVGDNIELTTSEIREERKKYHDDIMQRYTGDRPNLDYIKKYGTKGFTPDEIKKARNSETTYYRDAHESYEGV